MVEETITVAKAMAHFRAELVKIMPGYDWTVHRTESADVLIATGKQTSGFNRLSTLQVERRNAKYGVIYSAKSSGYGLKAPWLRKNDDLTLARALRGLQKIYEHEAATFRGHAASLERGRKAAEAAP